MKTIGRPEMFKLSCDDSGVADFQLTYSSSMDEFTESGVYCF